MRTDWQHRIATLSGQDQSPMAQWDEMTVDQLSLTSCVWAWWVSTPCVDSIVRPPRLHWVTGVCAFGCNLPPVLASEWVGSLTCYCASTEVERILSKSQHRFWDFSALNGSYQELGLPWAHRKAGEETSLAITAGNRTSDPPITSAALYHRAISLPIAISSGIVRVGTVYLTGIICGKPMISVSTAGWNDLSMSSSVQWLTFIQHTKCKQADWVRHA